MAERYAKTSKVLAKRYGVHVRAIAKWRVRGFPAKTKKGFDLAACDLWHATNIKKRDGVATLAELDRQKKLEDIRAKKRENEVAEGKLIEREQVERDVLAMTSRARTVLLRIPGTIGSKIGNDAEQISRAIVQEALQELESHPL